MAAVEVARGRRGGGQGWLSTLLGIGVLVAVGFVLGLVAGVVREEPELVVGHVTGRSEEIDWTAKEPLLTESFPAESDLAQAPQAAPRRVAEEPPPPPAPAPARSAPSVAAGPPPAARPAPSPLAEAPPEVGPAFAIQVGAFADGGAAKRVAADLIAKGYPAKVSGPGQDDRWRVRVGPITGRAVADETARRLKVEEQLPTWVLRERGT